jgi:hypothetical protein
MDERIKADPNRTIEVSLSEAVRVFLLLEELVAFLHQRGHYESLDDLIAWLHKGPYPDGVMREIADCLYHVVWKWMPPDINEQIDNR